MKKVFLASAGIAATLLGYSTAEAASGYVGASYQRLHLDDGVSDDNADGYGIHGAVAVPLSGSLGMQFNGAYTDSEDSTGGTLSGAAHLFTRNDKTLFGGFVAAANSDDVTTWAAGGEFNGYMTNTTFAAAVAYNDFGDLDADGITAGGELRFFMHQNLRLDVGAGWFNLDPDTGSGTDGLNWGLGGEWQLPSVPVSIYGGFAQAHANDTASGVDTVSLSTIGVRYNFGGTLKDRDRTGASQGSGSSGALLSLF